MTELSASPTNGSDAELRPAPGSAKSLYRNYCEIDARRRQQADTVLAFNKEQIFPALEAAGITRMTLSYDGSGDSGCTQDVRALRGDDVIEIPDTQVDVQHQSWQGDIVTESWSLPQALDIWCMDIAETHHDGWEHHEGAYGEFTLDITTQTICLEHNTRIEQVETNTYEW